MAPLGALSQAWTAADAAKPHGWSITGLWRFGDAWIAMSGGPAATTSTHRGRHAEHALRRLSDRLRERRGRKRARRRWRVDVVTHHGILAALFGAEASRDLSVVRLVRCPRLAAREGVTRPHSVSVMGVLLSDANRR